MWFLKKRVVLVASWDISPKTRERDDDHRNLYQEFKVIFTSRFAVHHCVVPRVLFAPLGNHKKMFYEGSVFHDVCDLPCENSFRGSPTTITVILNESSQENQTSALCRGALCER